MPYSIFLHGEGLSILIPYKMNALFRNICTVTAPTIWSSFFRSLIEVVLEDSDEYLVLRYSQIWFGLTFEVLNIPCKFMSIY